MGVPRMLTKAKVTLPAAMEAVTHHPQDTKVAGIMGAATQHLLLRPIIIRTRIPSLNIMMVFIVFVCMYSLY